MQEIFLTEKKFAKRLGELQGYRYENIIDLESFYSVEDTEKKVNPQVFDLGRENEILVGDIWTGRDKYLWLQKEIEIPKEWESKKVVGVFDMGKTGGGGNSGFESMCYINGQMYQGVDSNHKEVFFPENLIGEKFTLTFRLWSGLEGGGRPRPQEHRIYTANLCCLDEKIDDFYYMGSLLIDTLKYLDDTNLTKHELIIALDKALNLIDWSKPNSEQFRKSVHDADDFLNAEIDKIGKNSKINVFCIGHTHIDVAWLWRLKHTKEKSSRSFSTVLRMMEMFDEYVFLQTQPQLYAYMKEEFPELYAKIKEKVSQGKWEVEGGMWVEADCNIISGESLTRQLLIGSKFIKDEFGHQCEYLWLPDVFGYSWAMPQILKKSGINTFMTTKISWNQYNRMPHDTFYWKGIDGTKILTHFITTPETLTPKYTYNGRLTAQSISGIWEQYKDKKVNKDLLISYGFGDGGGGVNRDMLEYRRRIDKMPGLPNLNPLKAGEYFKKLTETVKNTDQYVHTWDGELYLEYHRGTYTSQAYNKKMNRKMELLYKHAETFAVMSAIKANDLKNAEQEKLTDGWKILLTNQFHDIIPGSSIHEVYQDSREDYAKAEKIANEVIETYTNEVAKSDNKYTIYNSSGFTRDEIVEIPSSEKLKFKDENQNVLDSEYKNGINYVKVDAISPVGYKVIEAHSSNANDDIICDFAVNGRCIETPIYTVEFNEVGQICSLLDKRTQRQVLAKDEVANVFEMFEDKPNEHQAWDVDIFYQQKVREINELTKFEVSEVGKLRLVIDLAYNYMDSSIAQQIVFYRDNARIDFVTRVDMHEKQQLMKVKFPVNVRATYATYDVQYGNVRRANHWNTSWDQAKFETVAHRFADMSDRNYGVALLNDCKYGYDVKDNVLRLTLLKTATHPDHLQDQGLHEFTYSLLPHESDFVGGEVVQQASSLNESLKVIQGEEVSATNSLVSIDNDQIEFDALKKSEKGDLIVLRMHEYAGAMQKAKVKLGFELDSWAEGDLKEDAIEEFKSSEIELDFGCYEIKTVLIKL